MFSFALSVGSFFFCFFWCFVSFIDALVLVYFVFRMRVTLCMYVMLRMTRLLCGFVKCDVCMLFWFAR